MNMPYDIDNPPQEPPPGCDPILWKVAYALREEHVEGPDGFCVAAACRRAASLWPCPKRNLADVGLMGSIGGGRQPPGPNARWVQPARTRRPRNESH